ncbi:ABC transporter permease [Vallitalea longa]|uniref:ABC transporter permease n=1 Tax=Vallitalea longa TaxID=2936439 RepID=UPI00249098E5|nr:ABC transporter permease subunit [Vallitalea longa]
MLLPSLIILICFSYIPMYGVLISFKDYKGSLGIMGSPWADPWYKYFIKYFNSYQFVSTIKNTLVLTGYNLLVGFPIPIIFALAINQMRNNKYKKTFQTISYMPHFISTVVIVGIINLIFSPGTGLIGQIYDLFGAKAPNLLGSTSAFKHLYVWSDIWQHMGWDSIIYIAALSSVDPNLYEAASIDGASQFQKILYVDIPMLIPTAMTLLILRCGGLMALGFEKVYLMQNDLNLLNSEVISTYVYKLGMKSSQYSYSSAVNLFSTIINFILLISVNKFSRKVSDNSLW